MDQEKSEVSRKSDVLDYDQVLDHIGQFGTFQRKIFIWLSFVSAAAGLAVVTFAFTGEIPLHNKENIFKS